MIVKMCIKYTNSSASAKCKRQRGKNKKNFVSSVATTTKAPQRVIDKNVKQTHAVKPEQSNNNNNHNNSSKNNNTHTELGLRVSHFTTCTNRTTTKRTTTIDQLQLLLLALLVLLLLRCYCWRMAWAKFDGKFDIDEFTICI